MTDIRSGESDVPGTVARVTLRGSDLASLTEERFRLIIDAIPAMVVCALPDGSLEFANRGWQEYTGRSLDEMTGWAWHDVIHPDDLPSFAAKLSVAQIAGKPFENEARVRRADGQYRWFLIRTAPMLDEAGQVIRWYGTGQDIDDRKAAEERLRHENVALRREIDKAPIFEGIVVASPAIRGVLARVARVAPTDSTVLITGETGTGKELIARAIHKGSPRFDRAFVSVNCAAIPPALIASELFGYERGAFTGALQRHLGRFELAEGGTLFLDEIGDLPAEMQVALLRVLQEKEIQRVGGSQPIPVDVRVIAATNRDLEAAIDTRAFRSDLFYRLNVFPIEVPPLRERREGIPSLVEHFLDRYAKKMGKTFKGIDPKSLDLLQSYPWPGNIRELQNLIERSVIVCDTELFSVDASWLSHRQSPARPASPPLRSKLAGQEREAIEAALAETRGRVAGPSGAAVKLGLPSTTLESKIKSLGINKHQFKSPGGTGQSLE